LTWKRTTVVVFGTFGPLARAGFDTFAASFGDGAGAVAAAVIDHEDLRVAGSDASRGGACFIDGAAEIRDLVIRRDRDGQQHS